MLITTLIMVTLTVAVITMVGALLQLSALLPDEPLLKIFSRYLADDGKSGELLSPSDARNKMTRLRRKIYIMVALTIAIAIATAIIATIWTWNLGGILTVIFIALALNGLILAGTLSLWSRRLKRISFDTIYDPTPSHHPSPSNQD